MPAFTSDGLSLNYVDDGAGPPVLLIHGFASSLRMNWVGTGWVAALVAAGHRVIAFDHRGHGDSDKIYDPPRYGIGDMARDALALLDHLSIPRASIVGYSMGARVGALLAIEHAERVASLVIGGMGSRLFEGAAKGEEIAQALEAPDRNDVADPYARTFRVFAETTKSDLRALAAVSRSPRLPLSRDMLAQITCPSLIVVGSDDDVAGTPDELAAAIAGSKVLVIQGRDHNRTVGDARFREAVVDFFRGAG